MRVPDRDSAFALAIAVAFAFSGLAAPIFAQNGGPALAAPVDGGAQSTLRSIFIPPLPNAPFTLTLATRWVRPLGLDGNTATFANERQIARDSAGRIFQQRVNLMPPDEHAHPLPNWLQMTDPNQHTFYNCSVMRRTCNLLSYFPRATRPPLLTSGSEDSPLGEIHRKSLGTDTMDGVEVEGVQETAVIKAGVMGNARPVTIQREYWYSPELGIDLKSIATDPRFGTQTFTVKKISRDEPDPDLWNVPRGFTTVDERTHP